jgi:hypothetical protein
MQKFCNIVLTKINKLANWQVFLILAIAGFITYAAHLENHFLGDDLPQIVNNVPVHSITTIRLFFEGGTFYEGNGLTRLAGSYFRPLMTTGFSLIYTLFGPHAFYFHLLQLLLAVISSFVLYLFFRYTFKPALAVVLSLIFLLHPINSQIVYEISTLQDNLYFLFGLLSLYLLVRYKGWKSLAAVVICLFLSLLAKESGVLFVVIDIVYLFLFDRRKRLLQYGCLFIVPLAAYGLLRYHAIGLTGFETANHNAPIETATLGIRLLTAPSIVIFYLSKFIDPFHLGSGYFWIDRSFSTLGVGVPLLVDMCLMAILIYGGFYVKMRLNKAMYTTYYFFVVWLGLGILINLNIIPLDRTASLAWFYFGMVGLLGMLGVLYDAMRTRRRSSWAVYLTMLTVLMTLGVTSFLSGTTWNNQTSLDYHDIKYTSDNYNAYSSLAGLFGDKGNFALAEMYARRAITIYPAFGDYNNLASSLYYQHKDTAAYRAYLQTIRYGTSESVYQNLGILTLAYGNPQSNLKLLSAALQKYPTDSSLLLCAAITEAELRNTHAAKIGINDAARYGQVSPYIYNSIMAEKEFKLQLLDTNTRFIIP